MYYSSTSLFVVREKGEEKIIFWYLFCYIIVRSYHRINYFAHIIENSTEYHIHTIKTKTGTQTQSMMNTSTTPTCTMNTALENDSRSTSSDIPYSIPSSISSDYRRMGMPRPLYHANMIPASLFRLPLTTSPQSSPTSSSSPSPSSSSSSSSSSIFNVLDDVLGNDDDINDNDGDEQQLLRRQETTSKTSSSMLSAQILLSRAFAVLDAHDEQEVEELELEPDDDTMMIDNNDSSSLNSTTTTTTTTTTASSSNNNANIDDHVSTRLLPQ
jgi:hypothetical protein